MIDGEQSACYAVALFVRPDCDSCTESHWFCHGIWFQTDYRQDILKIEADHDFARSICTDECLDPLVNAHFESNTIR